MTTEERARAYDEALEKARIFKEHLIEISQKGFADEIEYIFPELKESEDERIRKWLISQMKFPSYERESDKGEMADKALAWLEKKGEKPIDKVEPKFKVGDWVTDGYVGGQITSIEDNYPCYKIADFIGGINTSIPFTLQDNYHLWTIQDAKDGDVLQLGKVTAIFKKFINYDKCECYCSIYNGQFEIRIDNIYGCYNATPATKEQRDLLFAKMKETGYEWDDEKKELREIESEIAESEDERIRIEIIDFLWKEKIFLQEAHLSVENSPKYRFVMDAIAWLEKQGEKPKWTEEDESKVKEIVYFLDTAKVHYASTTALDDCIEWIKLLKQRME